MRTAAVLAGLAAVVLALPSAAAGPGQVTDRSGDWAVPGQDIVAGQARAVGHDLVLTLRLATSPTAGMYDAHLGTVAGTTCHSVAARLRLVGGSVQRAYRVSNDGACSTSQVTGQALGFVAGGLEDVTAAPTRVTVSGSTISWTVPRPAWLTRGTKVSFAGLTHEGLVVEVGGFSGGVNDGDPCSCDYAFGAFTWR